MSDEYIADTDALQWSVYSPAGEVYDVSHPMTRLVYVDKHQIHYLFRLAVDEADWHELDRNGSRPRLFNYLDHTFRRCMDLCAVYTAKNPLGQQYLVFCTGLYTKTHDLIYCVCGPNPYPKPEVPTRTFCIVTFLTVFPITGEYMERYGLQPLPLDQVPPTPDYAEGGELRRFNPDLPLPAARINTAHLLREAQPHEMLQRLPPVWRDRLLACRSQKERSDLLANVHMRCRTAIDVAMKYAREDTELVALQYCRGKKEIQYLLPVNLTDPHQCTSEPECVVTLRVMQSRLRSGVVQEVYEVNTLLPLEIARSNARLVMPPPQKWLQPRPDTNCDVVVDLSGLKRAPRAAPHLGESKELEVKQQQPPQLEGHSLTLGEFKGQHLTLPTGNKSTSSSSPSHSPRVYLPSPTVSPQSSASTSPQSSVSSSPRTSASTSPTRSPRRSVGTAHSQQRSVAPAQWSKSSRPLSPAVFPTRPPAAAPAMSPRSPTATHTSKVAPPPTRTALRSPTALYASRVAPTRAAVRSPTKCLGSNSDSENRRSWRRQDSFSSFQAA